MAASAKVVVTPRELVINVTLRCPLKCAHCCFSSDMHKAGHLSLDDAKAAISEAAAIGSFEIVHFVGGDPFLHPDIMAEAFAHARAQGLRGGATTSGFWAKNPDRARRMLEPLAAAGLTELTISYDDAHAEFVREAWIRNAIDAGLALGLLVRLAVTIAPGAALTGAVLRERLGLPDHDRLKVYETPINVTGRAAEKSLPRSDAAAGSGPCFSVLRTFNVTHEGAIQPCCGVLPQYDGLAVGSMRDGGVTRAVGAAYDDPLFKWLAFEGPAYILEQLGEAPETPFGGVCEACDRIFGSPEMLARARRLAEEKRGRIDLLALAFEGAGLFGPRDPAGHDPAPPIPEVTHAS
jgi:hypothetical protein